MANAKLGRPSKERDAMLSGLVSDLFWFGKVETTVARGKSLKRIAERLLTKAINAYEDIVKVEKLDATGSVTFDQVLMVGDKVGTPFLAGATVVADVIEQKRDDKVLVFKKKRRQNYRRTAGHRQFITVLKIKSIKA